MFADWQKGLDAYNHGDYANALKEWKPLADQGGADAQYNLGCMYANGTGVTQDDKEAVKWYRLAADQGYAVAQDNLGWMYNNGTGVTQDDKEAVKWYRLAADQGLANAQNNMGVSYREGRGVVQDYNEAAKWYKLAAGQGIAVAQNNLGVMHWNGIGVSKDHTLAFMWFTAAASQGNAKASQSKDQVPIDKDSEIYKLIDAAGAGDSEAQCDLASALKQGDGIQQDDDAADYWLHKSAEEGDSWAQTIYGIRLRETGDAAKERESVSWFLRATEQGDDRARFNLGLMQAGGIGTSVDLNSGALNLLKCSLSGFEDARGAVEDIRPMISQESWQLIFDQIEWPSITFTLGPLAEGHLDNIRQSQENDDGSEDAEWLKYEREMADIMFLGSTDKGDSLLDVAFDENVSIKEIYVGRALVNSKTLTAVTIELRNVRLSDDFPVYWKPSEEGMNAVTNLIGLMGGRTSVRWGYFSPVDHNVKLT